MVQSTFGGKCVSCPAACSDITGLCAWFPEGSDPPTSGALASGFSRPLPIPSRGPRQVPSHSRSGVRIQVATHYVPAGARVTGRPQVDSPSLPPCTRQVGVAARGTRNGLDLLRALVTWHLEMVPHHPTGTEISTSLEELGGCS